MGSMSENNLRFRSKQQICEDIVKVLNGQLTWGTQYAVIAEALWALSEFEGKYSGCKLWSELAWSAQSSPKTLRHDHAVPRVILVNKLKSLRLIADEVSVRDILDLAIGVVITKTEDNTLTKLGLRSALPPGDSDPMSRYRAAKIKVIRPYDTERLELDVKKDTKSIG